MSPPALPLQVNQQLRFALEQLPATETSGQTVTIEVPDMLGGVVQWAGSLATIRGPAVTFRRMRRVVEDRDVEGWLFEGVVRLAGADLDESDGYPGHAVWLKSMLGPCCVSVEIERVDGDRGEVKVFALARSEIPRGV